MSPYRAVTLEAPKQVTLIKLTFEIEGCDKVYSQEFQDRATGLGGTISAFDQTVATIRDLNSLGFLNTVDGWYPISRIRFIKKETYTA